MPVRPLTVPPMVYVVAGGLVQLTATLVTLALPTAPEPFATVQICPEGWVAMVTA